MDCEKNAECMEQTLPSAVEVYGRQVVNVVSDIQESENVKSAAKVSLEARAAIASMLPTNMCTVPPGLSLVQSLRCTFYISCRT